MALGNKPAPLSPLRLLFRASQRADSLFVRTKGEIDLSPRQFMVLQAVADAEGLSQTAIMSATGLDRASTADLVRRLVAKGWLRRRRTKRDARLYAVRLTPDGSKVTAAGARAVRAVDAALMHAVDQGQRAGVLDALWLIAGETPKAS